MQFKLRGCKIRLDYITVACGVVIIGAYMREVGLGVKIVGKEGGTSGAVVLFCVC